MNYSRIRLLAAGAGACASLVATTALAAGPNGDLVAKLKPQIQKGCLPIQPEDPFAPPEARGAISAAALAAAIDVSKVAPLEVRYGQSMTPEAIAERAFPVEGIPDETTYYLLRRLIVTSIDPSQGADNFLPLTGGGFRIRRRSGTITTADAKAVLTDIVRGQSDDFIFYCHLLAKDAEATEDNDPVVAASRPAPIWTVAKSADDFGKALKDRPFAEAAMVFDEVSGEESYAIHGAVGVAFGERLYEGRTTILRVSPAAFLQIDREGSNVTAGGTNNILMGLQARGFLHVDPDNPRSHLFNLGLRYQTDDEFKSRAWTASALFTPQLGPIGSGNIVPVDLVDERLQFAWSLSLAGDWSWVDDPGDKVELADKDEYARLGGDLDARLAWLPTGKDGWSLSLATSYQVREDITDNDADAQLFGARLLLEPNANFAFGIAYDRGENLDSLEFSEQWRLTFGYRY